MKQNKPRYYILLLSISVCLSGCCTTQQEFCVDEHTSPCIVFEPNPVSGTEMDLDNMENIINSPRIKAYPVGRYIDPSNPNLMHEGHVVYRQEALTSWNRSPNAPTAVPLGPTIAVSHPERQETALSVEYETKIMQQNQLMKSLIEQNEALLNLTNKMKEELQTIKKNKK